MPESWVSVEEVASHLGVAKESVYRWIEAKCLPAHRVGRLWKFRLSEVDRWIEAGGAGQDDAEPKPAKKEPR
jgi:excisionase family DNA binding protein